MHKEILRMEQISVVQNETKVLENTWINLFQGEVIGLLGLNDSGKSCMMHVLTGLCPDYAGKIFIDEKLTAISSASDAQSCGIFLIQRSLSLISDLTVSENIFFVRQSHQSFILNSKKRKSMAKEVLSWLNIKIEENLIIEQLTYYQKFLVELCKMVVRQPKIIIIDGILSGFSKADINEINNIFSILSKKGISIILIDHRLKPITILCERIFVLRLGRTVGSLTRDHFSESEIFSQMIGFSSRKPIIQKLGTPYRIAPDTQLEIRHVCLTDVWDDVSFCVHSGEIVGLIDIDDPPGSIFQKIFLGEAVPESGSILIDGVPLNFSNKNKNYIGNIGFVTESFYMFRGLSIKENIVLPAMRQKSNHLGVMNLSELKYIANELISEYISGNDFERLLFKHGKVNRLFKKKISICEALANDPKCIIFINPTQNIDIASKEDIYKDIISIKQKGKGILVISSSIDDLISVCDRIIIIKNTRLQESLSFAGISTSAFIEKYGKYLSES